jgi:adenosine deaminase
MQEKMVGVTIQAAESIDSALACNVNRIGHCTNVLEDQRVQQQIIDRRIPLEVCASSNFQTKAVASIPDHPIRTLFGRCVITFQGTDH